MSNFRPTGLLAKLAAALAFLAAPVAANAVISCNIPQVTSITAGYNNLLGVASVTTGAWTISCTRASGDPSTFSWQLGADNGLQPAGAQNRGANGANRINYEIYRNTTFTNANRWQDAATTRFAGTITFVGASLTATQIGTFYLRVPTGQNPAAGAYTDTVTATLRDSLGNSLGVTASFGVSIDVAAACQITVPPGDLNFTYTSFQVAAAAANTTYAVRCTNLHAYSMALDANSSTLLGLNYTLSLSSANATGTGLSQTFTINGSIAGGQSGTCATASCSGTETRTLTVTY
jgi:spore coat protein U-like protein